MAEKNYRKLCRVIPGLVGQFVVTCGVYYKTPSTIIGKILMQKIFFADQGKDKPPFMGDMMQKRCRLLFPSKIRTFVSMRFELVQIEWVLADTT